MLRAFLTVKAQLSTTARWESPAHTHSTAGRHAQSTQVMPLESLALVVWGIASLAPWDISYPRLFLQPGEVTYLPNTHKQTQKVRQNEGTGNNVPKENIRQNLRKRT